MPKHLVMLYQQSQGRKAPQGKRFEANFNLHPDSAKGAGGSHDVPPGPSNAMVLYPPKDPAEMENMLIEYTANNVFGDFDIVPQSP